MYWKIDINCKHCGKLNIGVRYYNPVGDIKDKPQFAHFVKDTFKCKDCGRINKIEINFTVIRGEEYR